MVSRIRGRSDERREPLRARWSLCPTAPGAAAPDERAAWQAIPGPDTVGAALRAIGAWSIDGPPRRFDAEDWWFRAEFDHSPATPRGLEFGGLAGLCEVWLDGRSLLTSSNMHLVHRVPVPELRAGPHVMLMRFASLEAWLAMRRPRPRWRAPMVAHQQLRWARVSLLGRTPGWSPPAAAVGPWRAIEWIEPPRLAANDLRLAAHAGGSSGIVELDIDLRPDTIEQAHLEVSRAGISHSARLTARAANSNRFSARLEVPDAALWWPHTHGEPALYDACLRVRMRGFDAPVTLDLGRIGFRRIELDLPQGDFALRINGVPVFCRGACWTPLDVTSLKHTPETCRQALEQVRAAGMNMLRVSGSMVYEDEAFHDACDALGILVWQDFMFANMDYPAADPAFAASVREEAVQQLTRWQCRPSLAVLCGNSEVAQQAAFWGAPREAWSSPFFERELAELARAHCPDVPWWPSSAHGGAFPHQASAGTTAYYGVGAYRRPLADARQSGLRFATECLAFANLPPPATLARLAAGRIEWKSRTPRDLGAAWDFEDVRDHYLRQLFGVDPVALRSHDAERYLALSRASAAEVMQAAFAEWRRPASACHGALVWFLRDLWAGAGWGLLDDQGHPKAAFQGLRRALAPMALFITDEGTNGLDLHWVNDPNKPLEGAIEVALFRDDGLRLRSATQAHAIAAHGALSLPLAGWFDDFIDLSRAYRFGPAEHALVVATLRDPEGRRIAQAFHFPEGLPSSRERSIGLQAEATGQADGSVMVRVQSERFAQSLHFDVPGFVAEEEYFHLAPGGEHCVRLRPVASAARFSGHLAALNCHGLVSLSLA